MALAKDSPTAGAAGMSPFLTAYWRHLVMVNYEVWPGVLRALVPAGVEVPGFLRALGSSAGGLNEGSAAQPQGGRRDSRCRDAVRPQGSSASL